MAAPRATNIEPSVGDAVKFGAKGCWSTPLALIVSPFIILIVWFATVVFLETIQGIYENGLGGGGPSDTLPWVYLGATALTGALAVAVAIVAATKKRK